MHVIATAGHVDHGKSTLLRALTGMEPDRWAEEKVRGMTIDLGYVWATSPAGNDVAFVDVPGHERFVGNMLAGVGPVPAVLFVVAADEGWMPQSAEHLAALDALGVGHGLLVLTRSDLGDPALAEAEAREHLRGSSLDGIEAVAVSALSGAGLPHLWAALDRLVATVPAAPSTAPVRLWADRVFGIRGSGTVVTGTLGAGTLRVGDELAVGPADLVRIRGLQVLHRTVDEVSAVARVAVNLRRTRAELGRGSALLTPGRWRHTDTVDAWLDLAGSADDEPRPPPAAATVHIGSSRVPVRVRVLGSASGRRLVVRLGLSVPLPLHVGDLALLRDANRARGARVVGRVTALDVSPPRLGRRGAGAVRAAVLAALPGVPDSAEILRQRGVLRRADLESMGCPPPYPPPLVGDWLVDPGYAADVTRRLADHVMGYLATNPLETGMPVDAARHAVGLPDRRLVEALIPVPLLVADGRISDPRTSGALPAATASALTRLRDELAADPFRAPEMEYLAGLGLDRRALAMAERQGLLLRIADGIVLLPDADAQAAQILNRLPQPFTASAARLALRTTRRVVIPLLEHLDRRGFTLRVDEQHRRCRVP
jgi:selenocysteine-specific elongation factor